MRGTADSGWAEALAVGFIVLSFFAVLAVIWSRPHGRAVQVIAQPYWYENLLESIAAGDSGFVGEYSFGSGRVYRASRDSSTVYRVFSRGAAQPEGK